MIPPSGQSLTGRLEIPENCIGFPTPKSVASGLPLSDAPSH
jgi:hypothetical protein